MAFAAERHGDLSEAIALHEKCISVDPVSVWFHCSQIAELCEQTEQVFSNLKAVLEAAGSGLDRLVKTTVFLASLTDFAEMNEVYKRHAGTAPPARSTVQVAALPAGALIEIDAVAHI
jgi:reactive intermediate/imine deaminase